MTDLWIWGIIASLVLLAIGTSIKSAQDAFTLKRANEEIARLDSKISSLDKIHQETIAGIQQCNSTEKEKLTNRIVELEKQIAFHNQKPLVYPKNGIV